MSEDRLYKDFDNVENLKDIIRAREERDSAFSDDVDAMEDVDSSRSPVDPQEELTWPHPSRHSNVGREGSDVELMDTPNSKEVEFDWQDSAEEMLPTDPEPEDGMGEDGLVHDISHPTTTDLYGPNPSTEYSPETDTAATEDELEQYGIGESEEEEADPYRIGPVPLDSAMDTDSDEDDFSIEEKFEGEVDRVTALGDFMNLQSEPEEDQDSD